MLIQENLIQNSNRRKTILHLTFLSVYIILLLVLGVRRFIPPFYDLFYGSDLGTWAMYRWPIESEAVAYIMNPNHEPITIDYTRFLWGRPLISTTYPHLQQQVLDRFVEFLADREEIRTIVSQHKELDNWQITFRLRYRINKGEWVVMQAQRPLH